MTHPPQALDRATLCYVEEICLRRSKFWRNVIEKRGLDGFAAEHRLAMENDMLVVGLRSLAPPAAEKRWPSCFDCGHLFKDDEARFAKGRFHVCRGCFNVSESQPPAAEKQSERCGSRGEAGVLCMRARGHTGSCSTVDIDKGLEAMERNKAAAEAKTSEPVFHGRLNCPRCDFPHVDRGEWQTREHHTHLCERCKLEWRVEPYTFGVAPPEPAPSPASDGGSDEEIGRHLDEFVHLNKRVDGTHAVPDGFYGALAWEARSLLGVDALRAERDEANRQRDHWCSLLDRTRDERDTLRAEVEKLKAERDELRAQRKILFNTLQQCSGKSRRFREYVVESLSKVEARISGIAREDGQG